MGNLFGKKQSRVTDHDKSLLQIKLQRDILKQNQKRIENKLELERLIAKKLLNNGQRERAKLLLRKKKYLEQLLNQTDGHLDNIERMIQDLESAQVEVEVMKGLRVGFQALKKMNEILDIDEIERIMLETREGAEKQKEISDIISGILTAEDEADVDKEFEELLEIEKLNESNKEDLVLPNVPSQEPERIEVKEKKKERIAVEAN